MSVLLCLLGSCLGSVSSGAIVAWAVSTRLTWCMCPPCVGVSYSLMLLGFVRGRLYILMYSLVLCV